MRYLRRHAVAVAIDEMCAERKAESAAVHRSTSPPSVCVRARRTWAHRWPAHALIAIAIVQLTALNDVSPARAIGPGDARPYDTRLLKLSEILGTLHYLRELCGANEGQAWRERMRELIEADGATPLRRAQLTRAFNDGYATYSRSYRNCTPTARTTITRAVQEGAQIAEQLAKSAP